MSFVLYSHSLLGAVHTDQAVIEGACVGPLNDALALLAAAAELRETVAAECAAARAQAHAEGFAAGEAAARAQAEAQLAQKLAALSDEWQSQRAQLVQEVGELALQVVQRIAASLGPAPVVAALVETAARELVDEAALRVRVHPHVCAAVQARLNGGGLQCVGSEALVDEFSAILETEDRRYDAGLNSQLRALQRAFDDACTRRQAQR